MDPKRGNVSGFTDAITQINGGNPNLRPEQSKSTSAGIVIEPPAIPGLRISADYTQIEKRDEIITPSTDVLLALEDIVPGRVTRAPLTPADAALGYTGGAITALDFSLINIASSKVEALDLALDYNRKLGNADVRFYALATHEWVFWRQATSGQPKISYAGYQNGALKWQGNAGVNVDVGHFTLGWNVQYYNSYLVYSAGSTASAIATAVLNQGSDKIPSQSYHDLFIRYRLVGFKRAWARPLSNMEITLNVQNVFDTSPPIVVPLGGISVRLGGYSYYGDPRLSRLQLTLKKRF